jgi:hypothetical protein
MLGLVEHEERLGQVAQVLGGCSPHHFKDRHLRPSEPGRRQATALKQRTTSTRVYHTKQDAWTLLHHRAGGALRRHASKLGLTHAAASRRRRLVDKSILESNAAVTNRLEALVARLTAADLARDLGGGWTVHVALGHLAFWDRRIAYMLTRWAKEGTPHEELDDDVVNRALEGLLLSVQPREAARLCIESAKAANAAIESTPDSIAERILAEDHAYLLLRQNHRTEHIEQIEAALNAQG